MVAVGEAPKVDSRRPASSCIVSGFANGVASMNGFVESGLPSDVWHESGAAAFVFMAASSRHADISGLEDKSISSQVSAEAIKDGMLTGILI